jgi:two-component system response regulator AtoC
VDDGEERIDHRGFQLLVVSEEGLKTFDLPREGAATIGRAAHNQVRIDHPSVSRLHARLYLGPRPRLEDLGGPNGTFVHDPTAPAAPGETQQLRRLARDSAEVAPGDNLMFGAVSAVLRRVPAVASDALAEELAGTAVVQSEPMRVLYAQAARAAGTTIGVLILGETGVGKELLARAVHLRSPRAARPFMGLNCAALGEQVMEGELFGYERGAFTGAVQARPGLFEAVEGGTLFLDEVGELPATTQAKLLRVLEERSVLRIGARVPRAIDVRFVAATNRDLELEVGAGRFRRDLYYRLNAVTLVIPPLRERSAEIPALASAFVAGMCRQLDRPPLAVSEEALRALCEHTWPGNVRELKNAIERAVVLCAGSTILATDLPGAVTVGAIPPTVEPTADVDRGLHGTVEIDSARFEAQVDSLERARILDALARSGGNQTRAAVLLGISRRTLVNRLGRLGIRRPKKPTDAGRGRP